jgi:hypothetical protein
MRSAQGRRNIDPMAVHKCPPDDTGPPDAPGGIGPPGGNGPPGNPSAPADPAAPDASRSEPETTLERLRDNAPDIEWTLPTGHRYTTEPPPALGHGSTAPTTRSVMELELTLMCQRAEAAGAGSG